MELDENGNPQPTGEFETVEADTVVLALGQNVDQSLIDKIPGLDIEKGVVKVDRFMRTGVPGIYAGGDMVPGDRNVTVAIGHGYKAAYGIDCYLKGKEPVDHPKKEIATFESSTPGITRMLPRPFAQCSTLSAVRALSMKFSTV